MRRQPRSAGRRQPREVLAVRPLTTPTNAWVSSSSRSRSQTRAMVRRGQVGDHPVHDVLALVEPGHRHRHQHDPGAGRHRLDRLLLGHRRPVELVGVGSPARGVGAHQLLVDEVVQGHLVGARRSGGRGRRRRPAARRTAGRSGGPSVSTGSRTSARSTSPRRSDALLLVLGHRDQLEPAAALVPPGARPLVGRRPGHERHPQRVRHGDTVGAASPRRCDAVPVGQGLGSVIVTRRFCFWPAAVALLATGSTSPCPTDTIETRPAERAATAGRPTRRRPAAGTARGRTPRSRCCRCSRRRRSSR